MKILKISLIVLIFLVLLYFTYTQLFKKKTITTTVNKTEAPVEIINTTTVQGANTNLTSHLVYP